jgi:hypothetical protein
MSDAAALNPSALPLLVFWVFTNDCDTAFAANHLALVTYFLYRRSYFHFLLSLFFKAKLFIQHIIERNQCMWQKESSALISPLGEIGHQLANR